MRKAAIEALGRLRPTSRRLSAVIGARADPAWEVRWAAVRALGRHEGPAARRALVEATGDPDEAVAGAARLALEQYGGPGRA